MPKTIEEIRSDIQGLVTYQPDDDLLCLAKYADEVPDNGIIIDIGTADGASAVAMATSSRDSVRIFTIDPVVSPELPDKLTELGLNDRVMYLKGRSEDIYGDWSYYNEGMPLDLVYIDGMHSYEAVKRDIETWGSQVKDGGYILIHDTLYYTDTVGLAAREAVENKLLEEVELIKTDIANINKRPVGMLVTRKLPWNK